MNPDIPRHSLAETLRAGTAADHERLDKSIIDAGAFASVERYTRFLQVQYVFRSAIDRAYDEPELSQLLPDLGKRRRLPSLAADLADLKIPTPGVESPPPFCDGIPDLPVALGWLYVAEGSNLGAAVLRKMAARLGLSDDYGARHLAPPAIGPARHWKRFTDVLNAVSLAPRQQQGAIDAASAAFALVAIEVQKRLSRSD